MATALVTREVSLFLNAVAEQMATGDSPAEALARAADTVFTLAEDNPLVHSMLGAAVGADSPVLPLLTSQSQPVIDAAVTLITGGLTSRFDELPPAPELRIAVETVVRVVLSHIVQPGKSYSADIAFIAQRLLAV